MKTNFMTEYCHLAPLRPKIITFSKTFFFSFANIVKYFQCLLPTTVQCRTYHKQRLHKDYFYDFYNLLPFLQIKEVPRLNLVKHQGKI